jgi:hypothetical protein
VLPLIGHAVLAGVSRSRSLHGFEFGDARADIINALTVIMGKDKAEKFFADFEKLIEARAKAGAESAIPTIRAEVRKEASSTIRPWMIGAIGGGVLASILGLIAIKRTRARRRSR